MSGWNEKNDGALLQAIREGSHPAFAALVQRHARRFHAVAYRFLRDRQAAEDTVQDALLKLWEQPYAWDPKRESTFTTWFYRVLVNRCLDMLRRKKPVALGDDSWIEDTREAQDSSMIAREQASRLESEIARLPERQRTALNLCFDAGLSNQQAADVMGLNLKALQSLVMRAKSTLKEHLQEKP